MRIKSQQPNQTCQPGSFFSSKWIWDAFLFRSSLQKWTFQPVCLLDMWIFEGSGHWQSLDDLVGPWVIDGPVPRIAPAWLFSVVILPAKGSLSPILLLPTHCLQTLFVKDFCFHLWRNSFSLSLSFFLNLRYKLFPLKVCISWKILWNEPFFGSETSFSSRRVLSFLHLSLTEILFLSLFFFLKTECNRGMVWEWRERKTEGGEAEEGCENCRWLPPRARSLW